MDAGLMATVNWGAVETQIIGNTFTLGPVTLVMAVFRKRITEWWKKVTQ